MKKSKKPQPASSAIIERDGRYLLVLRTKPPSDAMYAFPGGRGEDGETPAETALRELFEEMNIEVDISKLKYLASLPNVYVYKNIPYNTLDLFYEYEVSEKFEVKLEISEISGTFWLKKSEIAIEDIAFDSQKYFFENIY